MRRMSPVRLLATILPTLAIACAIDTNAALAIDTYYLLDIKAKNSRIFAKWQSTVPDAFSTNAWVKFLDGLSPPVDSLVVSYKKFYLGWVCWPHDCVGNRIVFLIAQDGSEAYGMLRSKALKAEDVFFGAPSAENRQRLKDHLDK
jgi:Inhibitor of vertebrate lysozyme (Ivy)